jgi:hypothetical protein
VTCQPLDACHDVGACSPSSLPPPPAQRDLVGWWKLDGDGADSSGGGHDLAITNAVPAPGRNGAAMAFDGTACLSAPVWTDARMIGASGVTMMAWVNPGAGFCPTSGQVVAGRGFDYVMAVLCPSPATVPALAPDVRPAGAQTWGFPGGAGTVPPDQWTLIAMTWDHDALSLYVNGRFILSYGTAQGDFGDLEPDFTIGCSVENWFTGSQFVRNFVGSIDEVTLYRRALSSAEIAGYYTASDPCGHPSKADGTACSDGNACTRTDTCEGGTCTGGIPVSCAPQDACHLAGTCDPQSGTCSNPPAAGGFACTGAYPISYHLSQDGHVSLAVYDANGVLVREILRAVPQAAGDHTAVWDGLDRTGNGVPAGGYGWKLLSTPGGLTAHYQLKVGDNYPVGSDLPSSGGPGTHLGPYTVAADGSGTYVAANGIENLESVLIKIDNGGGRAWSQQFVAANAAWNGARSLAVDGGKVYLLGRMDPQRVFISDAGVGTYAGSFDVSADPVRNSPTYDDLAATAGDADVHGATDMDVKNGLMAVAYFTENAVRWYDAATGTLLDTTTVAAPKGVAVANDGTVLVSSGTSILELTEGNATPAWRSSPASRTPAASTWTTRTATSWWWSRTTSRSSGSRTTDHRP